MSSFKLAVIGAGYIAEKHLEVINKINSLNVVSITSRTYSKSFKIAKKYKIKNIFKNIESLIKFDKPDAILILVSSENIYEVTKKVIPYKIPFFVEKPPGLDLIHLKKLCLLAKKNKVINMVGYNRRFYSNFHEGIKIIKRYGKLLAIKIEGHERFWKIEKIINKKNKNSWIYSNSSHVIDLFTFFSGKIKNIYSISSSYSGKRNDNFSTIIKFENGTLGTFISNWYSPGGWSVCLYGEKVTVVFKPLEKGVWIDQNFKKHNIKLDSKDIRYKAGFYNQMIAFKKLLKNKKIIWPIQDLNSSMNTYSLIKKIKND